MPDDNPERLKELIVAIAGSDRNAVALLDAMPSLAAASLARPDEFFLAERLVQLYEGDTALHAAAFSYDSDMSLVLIGRGAGVRARNRRGAEPLHAAVMGAPGSARWDPERQTSVIRCLVDAGADPNARAARGVTPMHRAVRNRCSAAVRILLDCGADARVQNNAGSTALDLARWTTGRGGTGSPEAKLEQQRIIEMLEARQISAR